MKTATLATVLMGKLCAQRYVNVLSQVFMLLLQLEILTSPVANVRSQ